MKKVLLVSLNTQEVFIGQLAQRLVDREHDVWRYYVSEGRLRHYNTDSEFSLSSIRGGKALQMLRVIWNTIKVSRRLKKVDSVHYHFIDPVVALLSMFMLPFSRKRIIATFWGSDFYKSNPGASRFKKKLLNKADVISFTNHLTKGAFDAKYPQWSTKTTTVRFGLIPLDDIQKVSAESVTTMRNALGISINKKIICLGTNASENQNHERVIKECIHLDAETLSKVHFLIPLGYPQNRTAYINTLDALIPEHLKGIFKLDTNFYQGRELATYRCLTDILVQVQQTDQFSGAMQEVMVAGGDVITGSWLPYDILKNRDVHYFEIATFDALASKIKNVILNPITENQRTHNAKVIHDLSHWDIVMMDWVDLYA